MREDPAREELLPPRRTEALLGHSKSIFPNHIVTCCGLSRSQSAAVGGAVRGADLVLAVGRARRLAVPQPRPAHLRRCHRVALPPVLGLRQRLGPALDDGAQRGVDEAAVADRRGLGVEAKVIIAPLCIFCMENH